MLHVGPVACMWSMCAHRYPPSSTVRADGVAAGCDRERAVRVTGSKEEWGVPWGDRLCSEAGTNVGGDGGALAAAFRATGSEAERLVSQVSDEQGLRIVCNRKSL